MSFVVCEYSRDLLANIYGPFADEVTATSKVAELSASFFDKKEPQDKLAIVKCTRSAECKTDSVCVKTIEATNTLNGVPFVASRQVRERHWDIIQMSA